MNGEAPKGNGAAGLAKLQAATGPAGVVLALAALGWAQIDGTRREAQQAIQVAVQHGQELVQVNQRLAALTQELAQVRAQAQLGGRFTRADGDRLENRLQRLADRVERLTEDTP